MPAVNGRLDLSLVCCRRCLGSNSALLLVVVEAVVSWGRRWARSSLAEHPLQEVQRAVRAELTEPRNHRMVGVGRDLCGSPSPTPCRSRVTYSRLHRTLSRGVLNISREGDSTVFSFWDTCGFSLMFENRQGLRVFSGVNIDMRDLAGESEWESFPWKIPCVLPK